MTAPAALTPTLALSMTISDNHNRTAKLEATLTIVEISTAANAANCHIVAPGSTLTIKAVEGNSTTELNFNNAALVWQDAQGMVKSVSANSSEKVVVVQLNAGIVGNAVVAAKLDDVIVWSWHVWVTDYDPMSDPFVWTDKSTGTSYTFMDRNLGAKKCQEIRCRFARPALPVGPQGPVRGCRRYGVFGLCAQIRHRRQPCARGQRGASDLSVERLREHQSSAVDPESQHILFRTQFGMAVVDWLTDDAQRQNHDLWGGDFGLQDKYYRVPRAGRFPKRVLRGDSVRSTRKRAPSMTGSLRFELSMVYRVR